MKKFLKATFAELNKVLSRNYIYIAVLILICVSFVCMFTFSPSSRKTQTANLTQTSYASCITKYTTQIKPQQDSLLAAAKEKYLVVDNNSALSDIKTMLLSIDEQYEQIEILINNKDYSNANLSIANAKLMLDDLYEKINTQLKDNNSYLVPVGQISEMLSYIVNEKQALPNIEAIQDDDTYLKIKNYLHNSNLTGLINHNTTNIVQIKNVSQIVDDIKVKIYDIASAKLANISSTISLTYSPHELTALIDEYVALSSWTTNLISQAYQHTVTNSVGIANPIDYEGFQGYNSVVYENNILTYHYLLDNNKNFSEVLDPLAFSQKTGNDAYVHDYLFYSLEIIKYVIIIFAAIMMVSLVAGEFSRNTMKLSAIRPINRGKFLLSKLSAVMIASTLLMVFATILNVIIGFIYYPASSLSMVGNFFGSITLASPAAFLTISFLCDLLEIFVFTSIALLLSVLTRSGIISSIGSILAVILSFICNAFCLSSWCKWLPSSNFGLFKYVTASTSSSTISSIVSSGPLSTSGSIHSLVYVLLFVLILNLISFINFKRRDI